MAEDVLDIGEVIEATGLPASTLHLWEREGLIETCGRQGLRRQYRPDVIERIAMIVVLKFSGFTLAEIGDLLDPHAFDHDKTLLQSKLDQLRAHRARLDRAIEGIEHGLACTEPSPMACEGFKRHLEGVLPVAQRG